MGTMETDMTTAENGLSHGLVLLGHRIRWRTVILLLIVAVLLLTRLWDMNNRAYSHDESTHAWESWKLVTGQGYVHDPVYHGPFMYHVTALMYLLFGVGDVTARLGASLFSVALVLLVWPLRRWLGRAGALFAMFLLTISPTMMHRGRFIRHDVFVIVPAMVMMVAFFHYMEDRKERWLYLAAGALSLAFCAKANAYITGAIFGTFWVLWLLVEWARSRKPLRDLAAFDIVLLLVTMALPWASAFFVDLVGLDPQDYSSAGIARSGVIVLVTFAVSAAVGMWWKRKVWLVSAGIFWSIFILLYTTLLTNGRGAATGLLGMLGHWLGQQGVARGGQPWYYYFVQLSVYEFLPWLLSGLGTVYYLLRLRRTGQKVSSEKQPEPGSGGGTDAMPALLVYWTLANYAIFTWSGEKMPWQTQHIVLPLALLAGWFLGRVWESTDWREMLKRGGGYALVLLPVALFSLVRLVGLVGGKTSGGSSLAQLDVTLRLLLSLVLLLVSVGLLWRMGKRLGRAGWGRLTFVVVFLIQSAATVRTAVRLAFVNQDYATEFLNYAASTPDTGLIMADLDDLSRRLAGDLHLKVAYDNESQHPFFWYLRDYPEHKFFTGDGGVPAGMDVVLVGPGNEGKVKAQLRSQYFRRQYRLIWWPNQDVYANLTPAKLWNDLKDPARREFWWDIFWHREYEQSTTAWPHVHNVAMYVRKDLAAQLWDYGPEVAAPGFELPEDEYEKKRVQLSAAHVWGGRGSEAGQLEYPKDIAVAPANGQVYVVDTYNHGVQVFDRDGSLVLQWGSEGNAPGQFKEPWGIAVGQDGSVFVADTWNHRIQRFDAEGNFVGQWGVFGDTAGALGDPNSLYGPRDICTDRDGNLWVSDTGNKRLLQFTADGEFIRQIGGAGSLPGQFLEPVGVACDGDGNLYVADTWNVRLQKFNASIEFVAEWRVLGWEGEAVTNKPYVAVDQRGYVYVTVPDEHRVVQFDGSGKVRVVWGDFGTDSSSFDVPSGIAVDAEDSVYVLDSGNHRVLRFDAIK